MIQFIKITRIVLVAFSMIFFAQNSYAEPVMPVGYTIQVGAFKQVLNAGRFADHLKEKGLDAVCFRKNNGLFAVIFGDFATWGEASEKAKLLKREKMIDVFYIADPKRTSRTFGKHSSATNSPTVGLGSVAARTAERFTGIPYHWGGNNVTEGMDCSGFVKAVYYLVGLNIPRTSQEQFNSGIGVEKEKIMEGDLVFFGKAADRISHVGLYLGKDRFIHAPRRGEPIQITSLKDERYAVKFVGAKRYM